MPRGTLLEKDGHAWDSRAITPHRFRIKRTIPLPTDPNCMHTSMIIDEVQAKNEKPNTVGARLLPSLDTLSAVPHTHNAG